MSLIDIKTIGFCGCSITEGEGLKNKETERYSSLVGYKLNVNTVNYSMPGIGNNDILLQALQSVLENDLTIVEWSSPGRQTFYHSADCSSYSKNLNCKHPDITPSNYKIFSETYVLLDGEFHQYRYISEYVKLLNSISKKLNKKVLYINGIVFIDPIFLNDSEDINYYDLNPITKDILNTDRLPDEDILKNLTVIREYLKVVDKNWINSTISLKDMRIDFTADREHSGPITHTVYADMVTQFLLNTL